MSVLAESDSSKRVPAPVVLRAFDDADKLRESTYSGVLSALRSRYPMSNARYSLELGDLDYEDEKRFSSAEQKKAILQGRTLSRKLKGTWRLRDLASGTVVDAKKGVVARVPYVTSRGTFIHNGSEYVVSNQARLKPGAFTRIKDNGIVETHFNVKPGTGPSFRMWMEPDTGLFRLGVGQSTLKLYPILRAVGVPDRDMESLWGSDLLRKNIEAEDSRAVSRAFAKLIRTRADSSAEAVDESAEAAKEAAAGKETDDAVYASIVSKNPSSDLFGVDPEFDKIYLERSRYSGDLFDPPDGTWNRVEVKRSPKHGKGLFAKDKIRDGESVTIGYFCDPKNPSLPVRRSVPVRWTNHSADPNAKLVAQGGTIWMTANKDIPPGEEICVNYVDSHRLFDSFWRDNGLKLEKSAKIGAKETDRKWSRLWFSGKLRAELGRDNKPWVYVEAHKGLLDSALDSLKSQGVECERSPGHPHISVLRPREAEAIYERFGPTKWNGAAKDGAPVRFALSRIVSLVPSGWKDVDRVWFLEVKSPDLERYRTDLGLDKLPSGEDTGHEHRFHISFAVHRPSRVVKRALALLGGGRSVAWEEGVFKRAAENFQGTELSAAFDKMELDPDVNESTLGGRFSTAGVPALLRASKRILAVGRGEEESDDRDSLAYQTLHGPEDFFAERISKDAGQLGRRALWKATLRGNLGHLSSGMLSKQLDGVLLKSGLGSPLEETNPLDVMDMHLRVSRMGEGGIGSLDAVPSESRNVQPSHFGFIDPIRSPESEKVGIDQRVAYGTAKGSDGQIYADMLNVRTGKRVPVSAIKASASVVAFPGEMDRGGDKVRAMVGARQIEWVDRKDVDFALSSPSGMFSAASNLVPLVSGIKGGRLLMGSKYFQQALPLKSREAPLVQSLADHDEAGNPRSFDDIYGEKVGAIRASGKGVVTEVGKTGISVRYADGSYKTYETYENFPFNRRTFIHGTPIVRVGDSVGSGQVLATSNYTDDNGTLAIGTNLRTAYMPYKGLNFEDAVVVSESAAKKLSSEHMIQHAVPSGDETVIGRKEFVSIYPAVFKKSQIETIDSRGVVKPGTAVNYGDPLVLALKKREFTALHRGARRDFGDGAVRWEADSPGVVTDVDELDGGGYNVTVKSYVPLREGDKLAGRYGDKGVCAKIVSDDQMIRDRSGKPFEILLNPLGIITRGNPSQIFEALLGKVARAQGSPVKVPGFMNESLLSYVGKELKKAKLRDVEDLFDPMDGKNVPGVLTGERFMFKLHHTAESKGKGRDIGGYTSEGLPASGGDYGSKRVALMELNALLSHGAVNVMRDAQVVRGQRNDDFWRAFRLGYPPPSPKVPMVYEKFMAHLRGSGVNVKKDGDRLNVLAMTDGDIEKMSSGPILSDKTVENDTLREIPGGLFDRALTGGHGGNRWSHIPLDEPMPNPIMEEPIRRMLGLTQKQFSEVLTGKRVLSGETGSKAILSGLKRIRLDSAMEHAGSEAETGSGNKRDNAVKLLGYYRMMDKAGLAPSDLMLKSVPVLPPAFRPVLRTEKAPVTAADSNLLYRDLIHANDDLRDVKKDLGDGQAGDERLRLYEAFKAVTGLGDPIQAKTREKGAKGLLRHIFGSSPKYGQFQRRVLGAPVDVVGRAVVVPDPSLNMDQVGIPEDKAWTIYRPFIMRRLVRSGMPAVAASLETAKRSEIAKKAMLSEMSERPVMINRAPTLHKYGFMAAWPILAKGDVLRVSPITVSGYNMDFDGDAANYHVPVLDEAVREAAEKMMPSKNLKAARDFQVHYLPRNEFLLGLHLASSADKKGDTRAFRNKADAIAAYYRGEIEAGDRVVVYA